MNLGENGLKIIYLFEYLEVYFPNKLLSNQFLLLFFFLNFKSNHTIVGLRDNFTSIQFQLKIDDG